MLKNEHCFLLMAVYGGNPSSYECPECGCKSYETGQIRVSGGFWSSFFDVGNRRYNAVSCANCGYTKFYKRNVSGISQIFDYLGS